MGRLDPRPNHRRGSGPRKARICRRRCRCGSSGMEFGIINSGARCLAWVVVVFALSSCQNHLAVSPRGHKAPRLNGTAPVFCGQSHTSSYPDDRDYVDAGPLAPTPTSSASSTSAFPKREEKAANEHYKVIRGDTLFSIGRRYGLTVASIQNANGLTTDRIFPGDVLAIPPHGTR
jgi:LysM repeat protein